MVEGGAGAGAGDGDEDEGIDREGIERRDSVESSEVGGVDVEEGGDWAGGGVAGLGAENEESGAGFGI